MKNKINIALCTDRNYLIPTMTCMLSIVNNNDTDIDFYIAHSSLEKEDFLILESKIKSNGHKINILSLEVSDTLFQNYPILGRSKEAYYRLLIPYLLPEDLDRCLYLDGDTIVQNNLYGLYDTPFDGKVLVVCEDLGENIFYSKERHDILGIPKSYKYFNSGVLLFNVKLFRNSVDRDLMLSFVEKNPEKIKFLDQDVLNALLYDKVKYVDSSLYDYMEILINPSIANKSIEKAVIVHFLKKPWKINYNGVNAKYWWKYGKKINSKKYLIFLVSNLLYRKITGFLLLFVSVETLKKVRSYVK